MLRRVFELVSRSGRRRRGGPIEGVQHHHFRDEPARELSDAEIMRRAKTSARQLENTLLSKQDRELLKIRGARRLGKSPP